MYKMINSNSSKKCGHEYETLYIGIYFFNYNRSNGCLKTVSTDDQNFNVLL